MKQSIVNFLSFKGKNLLFLSKNGTFYIAIKPVCEAIGVDYIRQFKNLSEDAFLQPVLSKQTIQVPGDQARNMICLPERYVYGWILTIRSESKDLLDYKRECYDILFNHFHGVMTGRRELLQEKVSAQSKIRNLEESLREDEKFKEYEQLKAQIARIGLGIKALEKKEIQEVATLFTGIEEL